MMKRNFCILLYLASALLAWSGVNIENLRCEYLTNPLGIDAPSPRLSWEVAGDAPAKLAVTVTDMHSGREVWRSAALPADTRRVEADFKPSPHTLYGWTVEALTAGGKREAEASATFETGKLSAADWKAQWITDGNDKEFEPAPMLRKEFKLKSVPKDARMYVSAAGYYVVYVNGKRVGDSYMDPGYTHYDKRNLYATYNVTPYLKKGENTVCAILGNGFYNCQSKASWDYENARWRNRPSMIMEIRDMGSKGNDGSLLVATDTSWKTATGPYTYNNIYSGDRQDNRKMPCGWMKARFNDSDWADAKAVDSPSPLLKTQAMPAIRPVGIIRPKLLSSFGDTVFVFDMGRNIAGVTELSVKGDAGTHFKLSHGELLKDNGRLQPGNIDVYYHPVKPGEQFQTDEFILGGTGNSETFRPEFTYHGFRYVEVKTDRPFKLGEDNVKGLMIHTDLRPAGSFKSSNPLLDRIYAATMLSYVDNLHSIPTDCPQREKNGWTADAHVAVDLGLLNYDGIAFYEKWMRDFIDNQKESGNVAGIIPTSSWGYGEWPGPVWDAALFIIPDAIYNYYGDASIIKELYPTMERYFEWCKRNEKEDGLLTNGIGDWLIYKTQTPTDYTSTLYYYLDCKYMARFSKLLGKDAEPYEVKAAKLRNLLNERFFNPETKLYANGSQAAQALALYAGIVPKTEEKAVAEKLRDMVAKNDHFLDFGLLGSKTVMRMLTKYGYVDDAYKMAVKTDAPSWGYWLDKCGYTTLAETWTLSPEFHDASINHVFMGDISAWMTNCLAGINYDEANPGFKNIIIDPHFPEGLESAEAEYHSVRGTVKSSWKRDGSTIKLTVVVPQGSTATVFTPQPQTVAAGRHTFTITK